MRKRNQDLTTIPVSLSVKSGFTGLVVVRMEKGQETAQFPLRKNEFFGTLESFLDAARMAGYQVIPPAA